jgi:transposase-like protein/IS1 family transposase
MFSTRGKPQCRRKAIIGPPCEKVKSGIVTCIRCQHQTCKRFGYFGKRRIQRWRCASCNSTFCEPHDKLTRDTMTSRPEVAELVVKCLVEGCSIRTTERLTGVNRNTIMRLLLIASEHCARMMRHKLENLAVERIQCDELHCFVQKRERMVSIEETAEVGEQYTFIAMDADSKLVFSWLTGKRTLANTYTFMRDVHARTAWGLHPQLTTDAWGPYISAVKATFGQSVDFGQLQKIYGHLPPGRQGYAPSRFVEAISKVVTGNPDPRHISTSYIERQNLTLRMMNRRFTRLTNAFSKKLSHLKAAITLHFAYYNFCRVHGSLRVTPAMEAGLTDHVWSIAELLESQTS